jgi:hypothetical protein
MTQKKRKAGSFQSTCSDLRALALICGNSLLAVKRDSANLRQIPSQNLEKTPVFFGNEVRE